MESNYLSLSISHHLGRFFFKYLIPDTSVKRTVLLFSHPFLLNHAFSSCPWCNAYFHLGILEMELQEWSRDLSISTVMLCRFPGCKIALCISTDIHQPAEHSYNVTWVVTENIMSTYLYSPHTSRHVAVINSFPSLRLNVPQDAFASCERGKP